MRGRLTVLNSLPIVIFDDVGTLRRIVEYGVKHPESSVVGQLAF